MACKVSILVPVYGVEQYIERCARSLFEQTYKDLEYIFVDDCTPDRSIDVLQAVLADYPDRAAQVRIIRHEQNSGVGAARQTLLQAATGRYVTFVDSDDFLMPRAVELLVETAEAQQAEVVEGAFVEWNGQAGPVQQPRQMDMTRFLRLALCQNILPNRLWGRVYRRDVIGRNRVFFEPGIDYAEDLLWCAKLFLNVSRRVCVNEPVYAYRTDNVNSYTHNISEKNLRSYSKAMQCLADYYTERAPRGKYTRAIDFGMFNAYRWAVKASVPLSVVDECLSYQPKSRVIRMLIRAIRKCHSLQGIEPLYLACRRLYTFFC